jgi:hypothetical protein
VEALRERAAADALRPVPPDAYAEFLFLCGCALAYRANSACSQPACASIEGAHARAPPAGCEQAEIVLELSFFYFLYFLALLMFEG